jgi:hypothetical protein
MNSNNLVIPKAVLINLLVAVETEFDIIEEIALLVSTEVIVNLTFTLFASILSLVVNMISSLMLFKDIPKVSDTADRIAVFKIIEFSNSDFDKPDNTKLTEVFTKGSIVKEEPKIVILLTK